MDTTELCFMPATELSRLIHAKELSPVELTEAVLDRIDKINPKINAFITITADLAREGAKEAEARALRGELISPVDGIPLSIKDVTPTAGIRTTLGSKFLENNVPTEDNLVAKRMRGAGVVILGKTNTPAYGYKDMADNLLGPPARNPWKLDRTTGGSSGGAAGAIAAGLGPLAEGSDGAGSIRIPASLSGVVGFKASYGRVPNGRPISNYWAAISHSGPLTRTVRDAAMLLQVMAGPDASDPLSIDSPPDDYVAACDGDIKGLKVVWSGDLGYAAVDPEVKEIARRAALRFKDLGCILEERDPRWDNPYQWAKDNWSINQAAREYERGQLHPDWLEPTLTIQIFDALRFTAIDFHKMLQARSKFYDQARAFFESCDVLLTPTMPVGAWSVEPGLEEGPGEIGGRKIGHSLFDRVPFTFPHNQTGYPAITLPAGFTSEGLPVGLQIVGRWHQDSTVLKAAANFEAIQPWAEKRPNLD